VLLTTSCTDALEMSALLSRVGPGDEVIVPSFTFVSTANAFVLRGAKIVFADSNPLNPNIDVDKLESLITPNTRAIAIVHYAGIANDMDRIMDIAARNGLVVIEDAAHSIDSYYKKKPLGGIGHFGTFSYHETKNIISGEGGSLAINSPEYIDRAEIIWEKGTNRVAFKRGEVSKYEWVDVGSSYLPSEVISAILYAQLKELKKIQKRRKEIWHLYNQLLAPLAQKGKIKLPYLPDYATVNGHIFYVLTEDLSERSKLLKYLSRHGINAVFHYLPLHESPYYRDKHDGRELPWARYYADRLIRLPFFYELRDDMVEMVAARVSKFYFS
jgi:dTDP-4-amino-4,6-dideoxygalactose transaminase